MKIANQVLDALSDLTRAAGPFLPTRHAEPKTVRTRAELVSAYHQARLVLELAGRDPECQHTT